MDWPEVGLKDIIEQNMAIWLKRLDNGEVMCSLVSESTHLHSEYFYLR